jgi:hypothetical protein
LALLFALNINSRTPNLIGSVLCLLINTNPEPFGLEGVYVFLQNSLLKI